MTKNSKGIKVYVTQVNVHIGKTAMTSKNNKISDELLSCSIKTRILKIPRKQIQNGLSGLSRTIDHTVGKFESLYQH